MTIPEKALTPGELMESVIVKGDLAKLDPGERAKYYMRVCESVGLNPMTKPLEYINLNGKLTLYAKRDAADQLRKLHGISIEIVSQTVADGLLAIHVKAKDASGRTDEDLGVVAMPDALKGEARANQVLKCITKAKRRVTLSISGLGLLDETEIADIQAAAKAAAKKPVAAPNVMLDHNPETGEVTVPPQNETETAAPSSPPQPLDGAADPSTDELMEWDKTLGEAALCGMAELQATWKSVPVHLKPSLKAALDRRHKPTAIAAENEVEPDRIGTHPK